MIITILCWGTVLLIALLILTILALALFTLTDEKLISIDNQIKIWKFGFILIDLLVVDMLTFLLIGQLNHVA